MVTKNLYTAALLCAAIFTASCSGGKDVYTKLNRQAAQEYLQPVRPASEGRNPCWNKFSKKFMYAPTFDVPAPSDAVSYRFTVSNDAGSWSFTADAPDASLAPIWNESPPSPVTLCVEAKLLSGEYDTVYTRSFLRDFPSRGRTTMPCGITAKRPSKERSMCTCCRRCSTGSAARNPT